MVHCYGGHHAHARGTAIDTDGASYGVLVRIACSAAHLQSGLAFVLQLLVLTPPPPLPPQPVSQPLPRLHLQSCRPCVV